MCLRVGCLESSPRLPPGARQVLPLDVPVECHLRGATEWAGLGRLTVGIAPFQRRAIPGQSGQRLPCSRTMDLTATREALRFARKAIDTRYAA
jgi:hypothetical protein